MAMVVGAVTVIVAAVAGGGDAAAHDAGAGDDGGEGTDPCAGSRAQPARCLTRRKLIPGLYALFKDI